MTTTDQHAHEPRHCEPSDLFKIDEAHGGAADELLKVAAEYLHQFAAPIKEDGRAVCFHCGSKMDAMMHALGAGAAYIWGMAHGEARCSKCGWPARGMHYPKMPDGSDAFKATNLFLAYHPDVVERKQDAA